MRFALLAVMVLVCGCPGHGGGQRPYPELSAREVLDRLAKQREALTSFTADSTMDYWLGNQRAKGEVLVMGENGAKVRFAALSPAGGSTLAEMACDGTNFVYVDYQNNCALTGPCDSRSIAQFFKVELAPDDFIHLALGAPPVIPNPSGTLTWDGNTGHEKLDVASEAGKEKIEIDMREGRFDVISAELRTVEEQVIWRVTNAGFVEVADEAGVKHRVPGRTNFKSPANAEDLIVEWGQDRKVNVKIPDDKFKLDVPAGLPVCGQKKAAAAPPPAAAPSPKP